MNKNKEEKLIAWTNVTNTYGRHYASHLRLITRYFTLEETEAQVEKWREYQAKNLTNEKNKKRKHPPREAWKFTNILLVQFQLHRGKEISHSTTGLILLTIDLARAMVELK